MNIGTIRGWMVICLVALAVMGSGGQQVALAAGMGQATMPWTIGLDPGHGWNGAPGAVSAGFKEKDINLTIALATKEILESQGFRVVMSRSGDVAAGLSEAARVINQANPNVVVSIHANSQGSSATGTESCYTVGKATDAQSRRLAELLTWSVAGELNLRNRGNFPENSDSRCARSSSTKWNTLYIHYMNPPTALIETAFMSNLTELDLLLNHSRDFAQAIADAVNIYVGEMQQPPATQLATATAYIPPITYPTATAYVPPITYPTATAYIPPIPIFFTPTSASTATAPPQPIATLPPVVLKNTTTILLIDTSGSMLDLDPSGVVKLDAAKMAGMKLLDVIEAENNSKLAAQHQAGVVEFSDTPIVNMPPTLDIGAAKGALSGLSTWGGTGMPAGLQAALGQLPSQTSDPTFIMLLSDGQPNIGLNGETDENVARQQTLELAREAGRRGICVYTIGFGDPAVGTIDEGFLIDVAAQSGCGRYQNAANAWELANIYISLRHSSTGDKLLDKSGEIHQNETLDVSTVQVPNNQALMLFTLSWPGSQLEAILRDPNGALVDLNYPGFSINRTNRLISIIIQNPLAGGWFVQAQGVNVPGGKTTYNAVLSVRPNPNSPTAVPVNPVPAPPQSGRGGGAATALILILVSGGGVGIYTLTQTRQKTRRGNVAATSVPGRLIGIQGEWAGRTVELQQGMMIGRASENGLKLHDASVSRRHAMVNADAQGWVIQDLNSQGGVFVNEARVRRKRLQRGDRIRIGISEFLFQ